MTPTPRTDAAITAALNRMNEVQLYNLHSRSSGSAREARDDAKMFATRLMIQHLRIEHKMTMLAIAHRLNVRLKAVKEALQEVVD